MRAVSQEEETSDLDGASRFRGELRSSECDNITFTLILKNSFQPHKVPNTSSATRWRFKFENELGKTP